MAELVEFLRRMEKEGEGEREGVEFERRARASEQRGSESEAD